MVDLGIDGLGEAEKIGQGGFAVVYRARQPAYQRDVAVKVLSSDIDETALARFQREIAAMGQLGEHPGIVALHEAGMTAAGRPYILMPYLSGGSLQDALDGGMTFSPREASETLDRLAGALDAAHDEGVLHRDIKPANVLLGRFGDPMLADFGIARIAGGHETTSGVVTASIAHAAPEILDGRPPSVASDIYSLASTTYHLMAGKAPFTSPTDQSIVPLLSRVMTADVPSIDGVAEPAMDVLRTALAKSPDDRYASASAFAAAFADAVAGRAPATVRHAAPPMAAREPVGSSASPTSAGMPARRAAGPDEAGGDGRSATPIVLGSIVAVLVVGLVLAAFLRGGPDPVDDAATSTEDVSDGDDLVGGIDVADGDDLVDGVDVADGDELVGGVDLSDDDDEEQDGVFAPDLAPGEEAVDPNGIVIAQAVMLGAAPSGPPVDNPQLNGGLERSVIDAMRAAPVREGLEVPVEVPLAPGETVRIPVPAEDMTLVHARTAGSEIDTALALLTPNDLLIGADDDSGGGTNGTNSRLDLPIVAPGVHTLAVRNVGDTAGTTTLSFIVESTATAPLQPGSVVQGELVNLFHPEVHVVRIGGTGPQVQALTALSPAFDADARLVDDRGRVRAQVSGGSGAEIRTEALEPGIYFLLVGTDDDDGSGPYTLTVR